MSNLKQLIEGLTPDQKHAVEMPPQGRIRIAAGAGSGKTEVLTRRIAAMLSGEIGPDELVAITYTQKAAAEMKARLIERRKLPVWMLRDMKVSTFHAFIGDFLKQDPFGAGIDRSDTVVSENDRQLILAELKEKFAELHGEEIISGAEKLGTTVAAKLIGEFPGALSSIRRFLLKPADFYNHSRSIAKKRETSLLEKNCLEWLFRFYTYYIEELQNRNLLDFDEILLRGRDLIKEQAQAGEKSRRRVFLIDEFQDNNPDQLEIINLFCRNNDGHITVVGDEKQSIYRFQGADIETFRQFNSNTDIILRENFRSYREIIELADRFLQLGGDAGPLSQPQTAHRGSSPVQPAVVCLSADSNSGQAKTCEQLADFIQALVSSGLAISDKKTGSKRRCRYGDIAIIVNSVKALPSEFEDCLAARQIPYLMSGGFSFYARSEIEEILAFLRLLIQPENDYATVKILTGPLYGLKDSEIAAIAMAGRSEKTALLPHLLAQPEDGLPQKVREFRQLYVFLKNRSNRPGLIELCHSIIEQAGFREFAAAQESDLKRRRMENNLNKFLAIVRNFEQRGIFTSLRDFLAFIERIMLSGIDEEEAGLGLEEGEALKIMTIHKAKGLEFPVVFCPFIKGRTYRADGKIYFDRNYGLMVADPDQPARKGFSELLNQFVDADKAAAEGEDRRKLYVAFTRAEDLLVICGDQHRLEKETEPLAQIHAILESNPAIGKNSGLDGWPEVLQKWLSDAGSINEEQLPAIEIPDNSAELIKNLESLALFFGRKNLATAARTQEEIFSLADLQLYRQCPRRYFFTRHHIATFSDREISPATIAGTMFHETVRIFHARKGHSLPGIAEKIRLSDVIISDLAPLFAPTGEEARPRVHGMFRNYVESGLAEAKPWMMEAEVNVKFSCETGSFFLRGFADRVDRDGAEIRIIDFKTGHYEAEKHASYSDQLALYMIAAARGVLGEAGCLSFARSFIAYVGGRALKIVELEPDLIGFEQQAAATVGQIRGDCSWNPGAESACANCGFVVLCHGKNKEIVAL